MLIGRKKHKISISLDNTKFKQVSEFKYPETTFTENGRMDREIGIRCNKANQVIGQLSPTLQHNAVPMKTKNILYNQIYSKFVLSMSNMDTYTKSA
jgi:hypothetical protein